VGLANVVEIYQLFGDVNRYVHEGVVKMTKAWSWVILGRLDKT
jgi:hypothetical protein